MQVVVFDGSSAFAMLVVASQATHRKLRDVAAELAETGDIALSERHS
jgi:hypothetical protein